MFTQNKRIMDFQTLYEEATKLEESEKYLEANELYKQLYEQKSDHNGFLAKIALNYLLAKKFEEYIPYALQYLEDIPDTEKQAKDVGLIWNLYHNLGLAYQKLGNREKALEYYEEAIAVKNDPKSIAYAGQVCMDLGHKKEAISFWRTAAKMGNGQATLALNTRGIDV